MYYYLVGNIHITKSSNREKIAPESISFCPQTGFGGFSRTSGLKENHSLESVIMTDKVKLRCLRNKISRIKLGICSMRKYRPSASREREQAYVMAGKLALTGFGSFSIYSPASLFSNVQDTNKKWVKSDMRGSVRTIQTKRCTKPEVSLIYSYLLIGGRSCRGIGLV